MKNRTLPTIGNNVPNSFINKYGSLIIGVLSGFDRLRLRGTLRQLYCPDVMEAYLNACRILIKDFGALVQSTTEQVKKAAHALAEKEGRPCLYVASSNRSKEEIARSIAREDGITEGLIAVLHAVEPCMAYQVRGSRETKNIHLKLEVRKCTHFYFYFEHPKFGFMHVRLQSWYPFRLDISLNGRHWLGRQLDEAGIPYQKKENTFLRVGDLEKAQTLLNEQLQTDWPKELNKLLAVVHPLHRQICRPLGLQYYWSASSSEFATDVIFKDAATLANLYPQFLHHAVSSFSSPDVMRFLGHRASITRGKAAERFNAEIISDTKCRTEGVRVKHSVYGNNIKFYDKHGSVLRVETTINQPRWFRSYRRPEGKPKAKKQWRIMKRGVEDLARRAEVSGKANYRYFDALAATTGTTPLFQWTKDVCKSITKDGQRYRGLNPLGKDAKILRIINQGEFAIAGFRNRDLHEAYEKRCTSDQERKRRVGWISRQLRLLRAHGLIKKVSGTHRYLLTEKGRVVVTALIAARTADVEQLTKIAA